MGKYDRYVLSFGSFIIDHWLSIVNVMVFLFIVPPVLLSPWFMSTGNPALVTIGGLIKTLYGPPVCDQIPTHSLYVFGHLMALCARCTAIYVSFLAGGLLFYFLRTRLKPLHFVYFILICIPMGIDGTTQLFGVPIPRIDFVTMQIAWSTVSNNELRLLTGAIFGLGSALFVLPYMQEIFAMEGDAQKQRVDVAASRDARQNG